MRLKNFNGFEVRRLLDEVKLGVTTKWRKP